MSGMFERFAGFFLLPAAAQHAEPVALPLAVRAVVVGTPSDAVPLAAAHALALRAAVRARPRSSPSGSPARRSGTPPAALRRVRRLAWPRGCRPTASVRRPRPPVLARAPRRNDRRGRRGAARVRHRRGSARHRAERPPPADLAPVAEHDLAIVAADPESPLARAALACLADLGLTASARSPLRRGIPRSLALAGLAAPHREGSSR